MDAKQLKEAGFPDQDVSKYAELQKAGFSDTEISEYLSKGPPVNPPSEGTISTAPPKWVPWARTGMEMAGLVAGSVTGGVPGAGVGYATARKLGKMLPGTPPLPLVRADVEKELGIPLTEEEYQNVLSTAPQRFGLKPPTTTEKIIGKAGEVGMDVGAGMAMEAGGRLAAKAIPKILPFYARGRTPGAEEVARIAEREGVRIPATDITGSTGQAAVASAVQKLPQSAHTMQREAVNAVEQFSNYAERTLGEVGGKIEPYLAGQVGQEGRLLKLAENKTAGTNLYSRAKELAKGVNVSYNSLNKAMADVQSSDAYQLLGEGSRKEVDKVISFLESKIRPDISARARSSLKLPVDVEQKVLAQAGQEYTPTTYAEAEGIRKSIADKLFSKNVRGTEAHGPIRNLYEAMQVDMEASAKIAGSSVHKSFTHARDFWSKNVFGEEFEKGIMKKVAGASPERAITHLKNASLDEIGKLKSGMPTENFVTFRQGLLTQILEKNSRTSQITGETVYNGPQIAKDLFGRGGLGEAKLKALMPPEEFTFLKEMATVGERLGSSWRIAGNPSGTAHTLYVLHLLGQVGTGAGALVAGEAAREKRGLGAGLMTAGAFLTPYAVAKLITSNIGRQYLISGFPMMEKAVGRMLPPGIAAIRGILSKPESAPIKIPPGAREREKE